MYIYPFSNFFFHRVPPESPFAGIILTLALCIPKVCSVEQFIDFRLDNLPFYDLKYNEMFCRVPNDKPFSPGDFIAM